MKYKVHVYILHAFLNTQRHMVFISTNQGNIIKRMICPHDVHTCFLKVKKVLSQGVMSTGPVGLDESSPGEHALFSMEQPSTCVVLLVFVCRILEVVYYYP